MVAEDSYEIMPYKEIIQLKKQIADLQEKTGDTSSKELLNSMAALTQSMNNMLQLFSSAAEEMKLEERAESELSQRVLPLIQKVDKLEEQNRTIAEGMVAIADMVKEMNGGGKTRPRMPKSQIRSPEQFGGLPPLEPPSFDNFPPLEPPRPTKKQINRPPISPGIRIVPRGPMPQFGMPPQGPPGMPPPGPMPQFGMPPPGDFGGLPPLPPLEEEPKKKGLFGLFKKK